MVFVDLNNNNILFFFALFTYWNLSNLTYPLHIYIIQKILKTNNLQILLKTKMIKKKVLKPLKIQILHKKLNDPQIQKQDL